MRAYLHTYRYVEIFARKIFLPISPPALIGENFITLIFCPVRVQERIMRS